MHKNEDNRFPYLVFFLGIKNDPKLFYIFTKLFYYILFTTILLHYHFWGNLWLKLQNSWHITLFNEKKNYKNEIDYFP